MHTSGGRGPYGIVGTCVDGDTANSIWFSRGCGGRGFLIIFLWYPSQFLSQRRKREDSRTTPSEGYLERQFLCRPLMCLVAWSGGYNGNAMHLCCSRGPSKKICISSFAKRNCYNVSCCAALLSIILWTGFPNYIIASDGAHGSVVEFTDEHILLFISSVNEKFRMHRYGLLLFGIIATGEILRLTGILSLM